MIEYRTSLDGISPDQLQGFCVGWKKPLTEHQLYEILKNSSHFVLAFDSEKNRVIGFVNALSDKTYFAFIPMIEVLPPYQGKGIGTELMKRILKFLEAISCIDLTCDPPLQSFYQRFGMQKSRGMVIRKYL